MFTAEECIYILQDEINKKKAQIELINQFVNGDINFTEEKYHELCLTNLRGSTMLAEELIKKFPFLKLSNKHYYINKYEFSITIKDKEYTVLIPCSAIHNISIIIPETFINEDTYTRSILAEQKK